MYQKDDTGVAQAGGPVPLDNLADYLEKKKERLDIEITKDSLILNSFPEHKGSHVEFHHINLMKYEKGLGIGVNRDPVKGATWGKWGSGIYAVCIKFEGTGSEYDSYGVYGGW